MYNSSDFVFVVCVVKVKGLAFVRLNYIIKGEKDNLIPLSLNFFSMDSENKSLNDAAVEDDQTETSVQVQSHVKFLKEDEIRELMESDIQRVVEIYSISKAEATLLLPDFCRDESNFSKEWFDDEESVRKSVGILERPLDQHPHTEKGLDTEFFCGVCFRLHPIGKSASVSCGHRVCTYCWTRHISNIINDTPASEWNLWLKCPYVSCQASVDRDMIETFASEKEKSKYNRFLLKSYIEATKTMKLCPRVASGRSCRFELNPDSGNSDVYCVCLLKFCWNCIKDVHSPVDCKTAAKWLAMNNSAYQSPNWVVSNTVPCPKCKRRIEHNQLFSPKMNCLPPCNYDFCWLCRGDWTEHGEETCNNDVVSYEEADQQWKMAKSAAQRYKDCYENWESYELLMQKAKANLEQIDTIIQNLSDTQSATTPQIKFIAEAFTQIMECRRVLKWTYAYEYYLREDEVEKQDFLKQAREDAINALLKKLDDCMESKLGLFLNAEGPSENFNDFCINLTDLTSITRKHYELLARDLENGLPNIVPALERSQRADNGEASGSGSNHED